MSIPLVDLKAQYLTIKDEIDAAMAEIVTNTSFIGGKPVSDFEAAFAAFCEVKCAVGVASGMSQDASCVHLTLLLDCDLRLFHRGPVYDALPERVDDLFARLHHVKALGAKVALAHVV